MNQQAHIAATHTRTWARVISGLVRLVVIPGFVAWLTVFLTVQLQVEPMMEHAGLVVRIEQTNVRLDKAERYIEKLESQGETVTALKQAESEANQALLNAVSLFSKGDRNKAGNELDRANETISANFPGEVYEPQPFDPTKLQY